MSSLILPKLKNIRVVPMSVTCGRYEVYSYKNKFTGKDEEAFLPELKPFGHPFIRYSLETKTIARDSAREAEEQLEAYIRRAFFSVRVLFRDKEQLTLGIASGQRWRVSTQPEYIPELAKKLNNSKESPLVLIPSQFYRITRKITDLY